jgi:hypothetical protein
MKLSSQMKAISYLKAHAAEIVWNLSGQCEPLIIEIVIWQSLMFFTFDSVYNKVII